MQEARVTSSKKSEFCKCSEVLNLNLFFSIARKGVLSFPRYLWESTSWGGQRTLVAPLARTAAVPTPGTRWHHPPAPHSSEAVLRNPEVSSNGVTLDMGSSAGPFCAWHGRLLLGSTLSHYKIQSSHITYLETSFIKKRQLLLFLL